MLREEPSCNGVVRVGEYHPTGRALDKTQQPNDPYSGDKTKPSGQDKENSFSEREKSEDWSGSEEEPGRDSAEH